MAFAFLGAVMPKTIPQILNEIVAVEGGYVNHADDLGGPTIFGITERVARKHGYRGRMQDMTRDQAKVIYLGEFIRDPGFEEVHRVSPDIAAELIDTGVNMGPPHPCLFLQRCLNAFNDKGRLYQDIRVDGDVGPGTIAALKAYLAKRDGRAVAVMLKALNSLQGARYVDVTEARAANESFTYGWFANRVAI